EIYTLSLHDALPICSDDGGLLEKLTPIDRWIHSNREIRESPRNKQAADIRSVQRSGSGGGFRDSQTGASTARESSALWRRRFKAIIAERQRPPVVVVVTRC